MRAVWYRRQAFKNVAEQAGDAIALMGFTAAALIPSVWLTEKTKTYITRIPNTLPAGVQHAFVKRSASLHLVVPSQTIAKRLTAWGVEPSRIDVRRPDIASTIERTNTAAKPFTTPGFLIAVVAPLEQNQGLETVIQAIQQANEIIPDLNVFLIGDGPDKRRYQWLIDQTHLKQRVHIAANAADYQRFLHHVDICLAPAVIDEGCDPIVLQARSRGVAVVATDIESHREFIENGKTGLLYQVGNSHTLSQHLINLYTHRDWLNHYKKTPLI